MTTFLDEIIDILQNGEIDSPRFEARLIAAKVLELDSNELNPNEVVFSEGQKSQIRNMAKERLKHRPLCKILGEKGFYKYDFLVNEKVLSPRQDTEVLVEAAIAEAKKGKARKILDLGTGSGCIVLSILGDVDPLEAWAVDASAEALQVAKANAQKLELDSRVHFINASWFDEDLEKKLGTQFDIIVSNPPYIPRAEIATLDDDVKNYDPLSALDGGIDGLDHYRQIAKVCVKLLRTGGGIFLEGGIHQENDIAKIFMNEGFSLQNIIKDLSGINRCIFLKK